MAQNYQELTSSAISGAMYDDKAKTLTVYMVKGQHVRYKNVPEETFLALIKSPSAGRYYNTHIHSNYSFEYV